MRIRRKHKRLTAFLLIAMMLLATVNVNAASYNVTLSNYTAPETLNYGQSFVLKGKIKSGKKISTVTVGVVKKSTGKWSAKYVATKINKKSFNVKKADASIKFGSLKDGKYYYRIKVRTADNKTRTLLNQPFTVVDKEKIVAESAAKEAGIKLKDCRGPGNYNLGKKFEISGVISAPEKIERVELGIVVAATNKWSVYKYDNKKVNSEKFELADAAAKIPFDKLPGGDFRYRMYVHTKNKVFLVFDRKFTVTPSNKPAKALKWAKKIANDDSFNYGAVPATSRPGCYFCGTNQIRKPKGYEKTYVCITFAGAAYAHGAKDPEILADCKKGRMTMYENNDNFKNYSCWFKLGACRDLTVDDLQPGDVIIKWADNNDIGHACIYAGGDNLVEAAIAGWKPKSIAVRGGAATRLASLASDKRNYVMRYNK